MTNKLEYQCRTRYKIKELARYFFQIKGFDETTLDDITGELSITMEDFNLYFRSKDDLLEEIWSE
jgi:AcrR family transcriptional regulator